MLFRGTTNPATMSPASALALDAGLVAIFGLIHSVMARQGFKTLAARVMPRSAERATYVFVSALALSALAMLWQPVPVTLWSASGVTATFLTGLVAAGQALILAAIVSLGFSRFFGLRQGLDAMEGRDSGPDGFATPFLYRIVRHPIMTGMLLSLWAAPLMTADRLVLAVAMSAYILIALRFEERDLIATFGARYRAYMARVPALIPNLPSVSVRPTAEERQV